METNRLEFKLRGAMVLGVVTLIALMLGLSAARDVGPTLAHEGPDLTPANVNLDLNPGGSADVEKTVHTPAIPPRPDICFLADTTGSMGPAIANVQANATAVMNAVIAVQPDAQFCAAQYRDAGDTPEFSLDQAVTASVAAVQAAINGWAAGGGGDEPEGQLHALTLLAGAATGWRPAPATHIIVWFGDNPGHDPSIGGETLASTIAALTTSGAGAPIRVVAVPVDTGGSGLDATGQATAITNATGGVLLPAATSEEVADAILEGLTNIPVEVAMATNCNDLFPGVIGVSFVPASQVVTSGDDAVFTETIAVAADAPPGIYECDDWALIDGEPMTDSAGNTIREHKVIRTGSDSTVPEIRVDYLGHDLNPNTPALDIVKSDNLRIAITSVELNRGPLPAVSRITFLADIPRGCEGQWLRETATQVSYDPTFPLRQTEGQPPTEDKDGGDGVLGTAESATSQVMDEPVGQPIAVTEEFELHCFEHLDTLDFVFCNKQEVLPPSVDNRPENNFACTRVHVNPINLDCVETVNPHGQTVPPAGSTTLPGPRGGQNEDGFYQLQAIGGEAFVQIFVLDKGKDNIPGTTDDTVFPSAPPGFAHGTNIKYTEANGATPNMKKMGSGSGQAGAIAAHITGNGDAGVFTVYPDGTRSGVVQCHVPPPPK